jgi:acyl-[acyl-carrier-protein] desaturase
MKSVQALMEDFFYREFIKYFKLAEQKRRWNLFNDIHWQEANPDTSETLAQCVETFCAVEMYLPDFTSKMLHMIRRSRGRAWFHVNWGYEESKHSLTLETWLLASGHRTEEQRKQTEQALLGQEWELPFDHPRQMVCYTMIQELATFWNYRNLEKMAAHQQDWALVGALRLISVDERVHYNFYKQAVLEWMKHDDRGTVEDVKYVFDNFTMPGRTQIPHYEDAARVLAKTGIYGPREYIKLVKNPVLEDLGLDKDYNLMEEREAQYKAQREAMIEAMKREQIVVPNGSHAIPKNTSPLNGKPSRPPLLEAIGMDAKQRQQPATTSLILGSNDDSHTSGNGAIIVPPQPGGGDSNGEPLPGSRGMPNLNETDQQILARGDELSNNAEAMREERRKIRSNRMKNDRLRRGK